MIESKLGASTFDVVVDRGVLHVLPPSVRSGYSKSVATMMKPGGILMLVAFSTLEPGDKGPHRFTRELVLSTLSNNFDVISQKDSIYHGALRPEPKVAHFPSSSPSFYGSKLVHLLVE
jgi:hypothetical protein